MAEESVRNSAKRSPNRADISPTHRIWDRTLYRVGGPQDARSALVQRRRSNMSAALGERDRQEESRTHCSAESSGEAAGSGHCAGDEGTGPGRRSTKEALRAAPDLDEEPLDPYWRPRQMSSGQPRELSAGRVLARLSRHRAVVPRVEARAYESADPIPPTSLPQTSPPPDSRHRILSTQPPGEDAWNCLPSLARPRGRRQHSRGPRQRGPAAPFRGTAHGGTFASRRRVVGVLDSEMEMLTDAVEGAGGPGRRSGPSTSAAPGRDWYCGRPGPSGARA